MERLSTRIRAIRKERHLSQKALAEMAGIAVNTLCHIEQGKAFPKQDTIDAICRALKIPESYLLFTSVSEEDVPPEKREVFKALYRILMDEMI